MLDRVTRLPGAPCLPARIVEMAHLHASRMKIENKIKIKINILVNESCKHQHAIFREDRTQMNRKKKQKTNETYLCPSF